MIPLRTAMPTTVTNPTSDPSDKLPPPIQTPSGPANGRLFLLNNREHLCAAMFITDFPSDALGANLGIYAENQVDELGRETPVAPALRQAQVSEMVVQPGFASLESCLPLAAMEPGQMTLSADETLAVELRVQVADRSSVVITKATVARWQVPMDIKPGVAGNPLVPWDGSRRIPVALYSSLEEGFDATQVDPSSVRFGPGGAWPSDSRVEDVNSDGTPDLLLSFINRWIDSSCGAEQLDLIGSTFSGERIQASDTINTAFACRWSPEEWRQWND